MLAPGKSRIFGGIFGALTIVVALLIGWSSRSNIVSTATEVECYKIELPDRPVTARLPGARVETWCYRDLDQPPGSRMIYQVDENGITKPELSLIVEADGTIIHASLLKGDLTVHRVHGFNPLNAPLTPPENAVRVAAPISLASDSSVASAIGVFQDVEFPKLDPAVIREGDFAASAAKKAMPWRGYWYPYSSARMYAGYASPLAKYDGFVARRSGVNPGAQDWESRRHYYSGVNWEGHCNGWAAASVLRKEPERPITDPYSGITFEISDLKGLWIERDYCPKIAFFGSRYWGHGGEDMSDIYPHVFHNVLTHYIGKLKKPVLIDVMPQEAVENRVVSGYEMSIREVAPQTYLVDAAVRVHDYDKDIYENRGVADSEIRMYRYYLMTDENRKVISGSWLSYNPDFLWVPLASGECDDKNEHVEEFWINEIIKFDREPAPTPAPTPTPTPAVG